MLENIIGLVKDQVLNTVSGNANIPEDKKDSVVETTTSAVLSGLKDHFTPDNLSAITSLFGGGSGAGNNISSSLQTTVVSALSEKVGLNKDLANSIASSVIPAIMGLLSNKSNDPNDSGFSVESIIGALSGKGGGGILGALGSLFGK
jgi:uncharacterized protein YidB (DUF937 family)